MAPTRSMTVSAMTSAAWMIWSRAAWRAMLKLARSGSVPGVVSVASADRDPDDLVGGQQGVDLLGDAGQGARAQDASAEHGLLDREVGGLDFPALVIELDQLECGVPAVVEQGGGQPVEAGVRRRPWWRW